MKKIILLTICLFCMAQTKCSTTKPIYLINDYSNRKPTYIAVLPVEDARFVSTDKMPELEGKIIEALRDRWYNVRDMKQTFMLLENADILVEEIPKIQPTTLCSLLNVDAILKSRLEDYESDYKVVAKTARLEIDFTLIDRKSGDILWRDRLVKHGTKLGLLPALESPWRDWIKSVFKTLPKTDPYHY